MLCYVGVNFSKRTIDKKDIHPGRDSGGIDLRERSITPDG